MARAMLRPTKFSAERMGVRGTCRTAFQNTARARRGQVYVQAKQEVTQEVFDEAYRNAYTMSQLYVTERPEAIPLSEHQRRRKERDIQEIVEAARKKGKNAEAIKDGLTKLEALLADIVSLDKMRATDWVTVVADVNAVAEKIILLKSYYPKADLAKMIATRPKMLLQSTEGIKDNASKVKQLLAKSADPDAIIEAVPDLSDCYILAEAIQNLKSWFPDRDPIECLDKDPTFLLRTGQSVIDPDEEYGIIAFT